MQPSGLQWLHSVYDVWWSLKYVGSDIVRQVNQSILTSQTRIQFSWTSSCRLFKIGVNRGTKSLIGGVNLDRPISFKTAFSAPSIDSKTWAENRNFCCSIFFINNNYYISFMSFVRVYHRVWRVFCVFWWGPVCRRQIYRIFKNLTSKNVNKFNDPV